MRRRLLTLALAAAGLVIVPGATNAQVVAGDSVVGHQDFDFDFGTDLLDIEAFSGADGENPSGAVRAGAIEPIFIFQVTCLFVSGNTAVIGLEGTAGGRHGASPATGLARVADAGGPGSGLDSFDLAFQDSLEPTPGPTTCASFPGPFPFASTVRVVTGDIVVTDAQPFPTSKDQCKNGGWRNYGTTFKNQGQCVAFVQRGPKA